MTTPIVGIELVWGKGAYEVRHNTNSCSVRLLLEIAMRALSSVVLPIARLHRFERMVF